MNSIGLLYEDLMNFLEGWKENARATEAQKKYWPQNRKISQKKLGRDDADFIRLLKEDGYDGAPVADVSSGTTPHFFQDNDNHCFPSDMTLFRFGIFFHLDFYEIIILLIKGQWEKYFTRRLDWKNKSAGQTLFQALKFSIEEASEYSLGFNLGFSDDALSTSEIYQMFEDYGDLASNAGYNLDTFSTLINQTIMSHIHLYEIKDTNVRKFIKNQEEENRILQARTDLESEEYWIAKCSWLEMENEIGRLLMELENQRLRNHNINHRWLKIFGQEYLILLTSEREFYSWQRKIELKIADPTLSEIEILKIEEKREGKEQEELEELKREVAFAVNYIRPEGISLGSEELSSYERECEKTVKKIWKYTHPDVVNQHNFSVNQKAKLKEYFIRVTEIKREETGFDQRSLNILTDILGRVMILWDNMGYDIESIQGGTFEEQLDWLNQEIERLEREKKEIQNEMYSLLNDQDIKEKLSTMTSEEIVETYKKKLREKQEDYTKQIKNLMEQYQILFRN